MTPTEPMTEDRRAFLEGQIALWVDLRRCGLLPPPLPAEAMPKFLEASRG